jgi:hypothetical protein
MDNLIILFVFFGFISAIKGASGASAPRFAVRRSREAFSFRAGFRKWGGVEKPAFPGVFRAKRSFSKT